MVLGIIGVLVSVLTLAVQSVRESARAIQCSNNLRQLGIACLNYESSSKSLPPACSDGILTNLGVWAALAGQIESNVNYSEIPINQRLIATQPPFVSPPMPPVLSCPSDVWKGANYRVNLGSTPYAYSIRSGIPSGGGAFEYREFIRLSQITDGTSNTMLFAERLSGNGRKDRAAIYYFGVFHQRPTARQLRDMLVDADVAEGCLYAGQQWLVAGKIHHWYSHVQTPNPVVDVILSGQASSQYPSPEGAVSASSYHNGGAFGVTCDGAVRFVDDTIDIVPWAELGSRAGVPH